VLWFANPALYQRAGKPELRDVVKHTKPDGTPPTTVGHHNIGGPQTLLFSLLGRMPSAPPDPATPDTTPGYDQVTGVGTPTGAYPWSYANH